MAESVDVEPNQPAAVVRAIVELAREMAADGSHGEPGPWWRAGIEESLEAEA